MDENGALPLNHIWRFLMSKAKQKMEREDRTESGEQLEAYEPMHNVLLVMPLREAHELKYRAKYHNMSVVEYVMYVLKLDKPFKP